jgi:hydrogenase maturation protease
MRDEGVGVHAIRALEAEPLPAGARLLDGGTGGFHLLEAFGSGPALILIDATMDGRPAGTVRVLRPRFASDYPKSLGAHDIGLRDLVESAALLGPLPEVHLITVSIAQVGPMGLELSPEVAAAVPEVTKTVLALLKSLAE